MPAKVKPFRLDRRDALLPREWLKGVEAPAHAMQGEMVVFAFAKGDVSALLTDRGLHQITADHLARAAKLQRGTLGNVWEMLIAEGVIDPTDVGVYVAHDHVKDSVIAEVLADGTVQPIARLGYDPMHRGRGLHVAEVLR